MCRWKQTLTKARVTSACDSCRRTCSSVFLLPLVGWSDARKILRVGAWVARHEPLGKACEHFEILVRGRSARASHHHDRRSDVRPKRDDRSAPEVANDLFAHDAMLDVTTERFQQSRRILDALEPLWSLHALQGAAKRRILQALGQLERGISRAQEFWRFERFAELVERDDLIAAAKVMQLDDRGDRCRGDHDERPHACEGGPKLWRHSTISSDER